MTNLGRHSGIIAVLGCIGALYLSGLGTHGMLMWDEAHYAVLGRALARGQGYVDPSGAAERLRPPVLPTAVAVVLSASPQASDRTILRITAVIALLAIAVLYGCVFREAGAVAATATALLFATFPEIWRSTSYLLTELPFLLFYTPAVFFFHRGMHSDARNFLIAWPCFALALMTRYTGVLFGPTCLLLVAVPFVTRDREAIARMRSVSFLLGPGLAAAMLTPWFARAWLLFGDPLIGFKQAAVQLPSYSRHSEMPMLHYISLLPQMIGWLPTIALPCAIGDTLKRRDKLGICCTIAAVVVIAWLSQYGWKEPRLVSSALPFLAIVLGLSVNAIWTSLGDRSMSPAMTNVQTVAIVAIVILPVAAIRLDPAYVRTRTTIAKSQTLGYPSFLTAMALIERDTPASATLMGPNCYQMAWYADRVCYPLPAAKALQTSEKTLERSLSGIDYVVVTSFERGQPGYMANEVRRAELRDGARIQTFHDSRFWTKIIPADLLRSSDLPSGSDSNNSPLSK